jgi:hypothetical protein
MDDGLGKFKALALFAIDKIQDPKIYCCGGAGHNALVCGSNAIAAQTQGASKAGLLGAPTSPSARKRPALAGLFGVWPFHKNLCLATFCVYLFF